MLDRRMMALNTVDELHERGYIMHGVPICIAALDPSGNGTDNTALIVMEREVWRRGEPYDPNVMIVIRYVLRGAWTFPQGAQFPEVAAAVIAMDERLSGYVADGLLVERFYAVECNGIGWGYASHLRSAIGGRVMPVTTIGGDSASAMATSGWVMPRQAAADNLRVMMEQQVFKVARGSPGAEEVKAELDAFIWKGKKPQAAPGMKDDRVLALMIAAWTASKIIPLSVQFELLDTRRPN